MLPGCRDDSFVAIGLEQNKVRVVETEADDVAYQNSETLLESCQTTFSETYRIIYDIYGNVLSKRISNYIVNAYPTRYFSLATFTAIIITCR